MKSVASLSPPPLLFQEYGIVLTMSIWHDLSIYLSLECSFSHWKPYVYVYYCVIGIYMYMTSRSIKFRGFISISYSIVRYETMVIRKLRMGVVFTYYTNWNMKWSYKVLSLVGNNYRHTTFIIFMIHKYLCYIKSYI